MIVKICDFHNTTKSLHILRVNFDRFNETRFWMISKGSTDYCELNLTRSVSDRVLKLEL